MRGTKQLSGFVNDVRVSGTPERVWFGPVHKLCTGLMVATGGGYRCFPDPRPVVARCHAGHGGRALLPNRSVVARGDQVVRRACRVAAPPLGRSSVSLLATWHCCVPRGSLSRSLRLPLLELVSVV